MRITEEQLEDILLEGEIEAGGRTLTLVDEGEWISEGKSETCEVIFTDGEKFYRGYAGRSGSYYSGYTYDSEVFGAGKLADVTEVEKKEVTITKWVAMK